MDSDAHVGSGTQDQLDASRLLALKNECIRAMDMAGFSDASVAAERRLPAWYFEDETPEGYVKSYIMRKASQIGPARGADALAALGFDGPTASKFWRAIEHWNLLEHDDLVSTAVRLAAEAETLWRVSSVGSFPLGLIEGGTAEKRFERTGFINVIGVTDQEADGSGPCESSFVDKLRCRVETQDRDSSYTYYYHGTQWYDVENILGEVDIQLSCTLWTSDFGPGYYLTDSLGEAIQHAKRRSVLQGQYAVIVYRIERRVLEQFVPFRSLCLQEEEPTWRKLVEFCRKYESATPNEFSDVCWVEGPVAKSCPPHERISDYQLCIKKNNVRDYFTSKTHCVIYFARTGAARV